MRGIDAAADHVIDDPTPKLFRDIPNKGSVASNSDIRSNPCKFIEIIPNDVGTLVQSEMALYTRRNWNRETGIKIPGR